MGTNHKDYKDYKVVAIGCSAGGLNALKTVLPHLPSAYPLPVILVAHRHPETNGYLEQAVANFCQLQVKQADEKESIQPGMLYVAPPNYHLLVEDDHTFSLSADEAVKFSRPSISVLFESLADAYGNSAIGIILTGGNNDGSDGLKRLKSLGALTIVQTPESAEVDIMPKEAIAAANPDHIFTLNEIGLFLKSLGFIATKQRSHDEK